MNYESIRQELLNHGCYLEHYEAWIGEPSEYRYILLGTQGLTLAQCKTLREVIEFLDNEKGIYKNSDRAYKTTQLTLV